MQDNARSSHARSSSARSSGGPGWPNSQNESSAPRASQPAPPSLVNTSTQYATSANAQYQSVQHSNLGQSPHRGNQPVVYPVSSQRTPMNDGPYPSTHNTFSRQNDHSIRVPAAHRGSDPPRMHLDHTTPRRPAISPHSYSYSPEMSTMDAYHQTHRPGNLAVPPFNQGSAASHQHPPPHLSDGPRDMNSMLSEFSISSHPILSSPPSSASAASPYFDKTWVRPSMSTMQMKSNSLEAIDDPESLNTFNSFIEHSDLYHSTTDNIPDGLPSRSSSSQSGASRSTSESDASSQISSFPMDRTGRQSNSASTSSAGGAPRKNKMHQCPVCPKSFPRPSGLETHMNSHTGARRTSTVPGLIYWPVTNNCQL
jgi:Zinc finger, C2H2 type